MTSEGPFQPKAFYDSVILVISHGVNSVPFENVYFCYCFLVSLFLFPWETFSEEKKFTKAFYIFEEGIDHSSST